MINIVEGQRYISEMEPELGIGTITNIESRKIHIRFNESNVVRQYAVQSAPLIRVRFKPGDTVTSKENEKFIIDSVEEENGLLYYLGDNKKLSETELSDILSFSTPEDRLKSGLVDDNKTFNLRYKTLSLQSEINLSPVRGFVGGRVELIPHQFFIANEVSSRFIPRVLLSDDTGLGKTIEACLVLHRLIHSERINRVLIIVPESLVNQWFVELYRRFNLIFRIFDEAHCNNIEQSQKDANPFNDDQLGICSLEFYINNTKRREQIINASWDMLVIDEAHHLDDTKDSFKMIEPLCKRTEGLMLLTATPEQAGLTSHFNNLRLIDPLRYHDFQQFLKQATEYRKTAKKIDTILDKSNGNDLSIWEDKKDRKKIEEILDCHGPGRIIFRNTRNVITDFPKRKGILYPLLGNEEQIKKVNILFSNDLTKEDGDMSYDYSEDLRVDWLVSFLENNKNEKVLLICSTVSKAIAIEEALKTRVNFKIAHFHEKMNLIQRDRSAAWFSEKNGARVLICSEIGSEGRNFQFASHLVMFDLPLNPELLEQRIGRLDRIGQKNDIFIHIPYLEGSAREVLSKWYSLGLNSFEENISGVHSLYKEFKDELVSLAEESVKTGKVNVEKLEMLINSTKKSKEKLLLEVENGRDKLLELNSFKPHKAEELINKVKKIDESCELDEFMAGIFSHYHISFDEINKRTFKLKFTDGLEGQFPVPALKKNGMTATFDRNTAVTREDIEFLNRDHPMVRGCIELFLGTVQGNSATAGLKNTGSFEIILETIYVLECIAPKKLNIGRFLPSSPIRIVVNHTGANITESNPFKMFEESLEDIPSAWIKEYPEIIQNLLPEIISKSLEYAEKASKENINKGLNRVNEITGTELTRLINLKKINNSIREDEILSAKNKMAKLNEYIASARLRLDAIRLIKKD